jgi:hypothetical protein
MHDTSRGRSKGGGSRYHGTLKHAGSVKSGDGQSMGENEQLLAAARGNLSRIWIRRGRNGRCSGAFVERERDGGRGPGGVSGSKIRCGGAVSRPATSLRRHFQRGSCCLAAGTPTGVPPPIGGSRGGATGTAFSVGCLLLLAGSVSPEPAMWGGVRALLRLCDGLLRRPVVDLRPSDTEMGKVKGRDLRFTRPCLP